MGMATSSCAHGGQPDGRIHHYWRRAAFGRGDSRAVQGTPQVRVSAIECLCSLEVPARSAKEVIDWMQELGFVDPLVKPLSDRMSLVIGKRP